MKNLNYLLVGLTMVALLGSCSKEIANDDDVTLKKSVIVYGPSTPVSDNSIVPQIIPGDNKGGNRTCTEVAEAWDLDPNPFYCMNKIDYNNGAFACAFPSGLKVTVTDGKYVSFEMNDCIVIGERNYKVGAVIVKGSNAANVYYYPDGAVYDSGLASPINASGSSAGLSNLTFCFIECEQPQLVIAVKSFLTGPNGYNWAGSDGSYIYLPTDEWCKFLGAVYYPKTSSFSMLEAYTRANLGNVMIEEAYPGGVRSLIITVTSTSGLIDRTYLYVGDLAGLYGSGSCPVYTEWPYQDLDDKQSHTFILPY